MTTAPVPFVPVGGDDVFTQTYAGKRVFLTGHTGFKGAWFLAWLHTLGAEVRGYALEPEPGPSLFAVVQDAVTFQHVVADIRDKARLEAEIIDFQPDFVFHLAAQALVRRSYEIPAETFDVNVVGTANLLEAVSKLTGPCTTVVITTDKVYENRETDHHYTEDDVLGGHDPYSASKAAAEIVVNSFRNSFFHPSMVHVHRKGLASVRAGNVIGGGDWSRDRIVPDIVRALSDGRAIPVRNPRSVRPWQHVLEPLSGYLLTGALLAQDPARFAGAYNFGPGREDHLPVHALVDLAVRHWGSGQWDDVSDPSQPHEASLLQLDISKAAEVLGWSPRLTSEVAIEWTVNWYRQPVESALAFTLEQIQSFQKQSFAPR